MTRHPPRHEAGGVIWPVRGFVDRSSCCGVRTKGSGHESYWQRQPEAIRIAERIAFGCAVLSLVCPPLFRAPRRIESNRIESKKIESNLDRFSVRRRSRGCFTTSRITRRTAPTVSFLPPFLSPFLRFVVVARCGTRACVARPFVRRATSIANNKPDLAVTTKGMSIQTISFHRCILEVCVCARGMDASTTVTPIRFQKVGFFDARMHVCLEGTTGIVHGKVSSSTTSELVASQCDLLACHF